MTPAPSLAQPPWISTPSLSRQHLLQTCIDTSLVKALADFEPNSSNFKVEYVSRWFFIKWVCTHRSWVCRRVALNVSSGNYPATSSIFRNEDHKAFQSGGRKMGKWAAVPWRSLLSGFLERFSGSSRDVSRGYRTLGVSETGKWPCCVYF